jgi:hypothetical protein
LIACVFFSLFDVGQSSGCLCVCVLWRCRDFKSHLAHPAVHIFLRHWQSTMVPTCALPKLQWRYVCARARARASIFVVCFCMRHVPALFSCHRMRCWSWDTWPRRQGCCRRFVATMPMARCFWRCRFVPYVLNTYHPSTPTEGGDTFLQVTSSGCNSARTFSGAIRVNITATPPARNQSALAAKLGN